MPQANTLFIGALPAEGGWTAGQKSDVPQIIDIDSAHPLMQWMDMGDVLLAAGTPLKPPSGATVLVDSDLGPMMAIAPRDSFEDVVLGFTIVEEQAGADGKTKKYYGTNWPTRQSFPVFMRNLFEYCGGRPDRQRRRKCPAGHAGEFGIARRANDAEHHIPYVVAKRN